MDKKELIKFLKDNLKIETKLVSNEPYDCSTVIGISLYIGEEKIAENNMEIPKTPSSILNCLI